MTKEHNKTPLFDALKEHHQNNVIPFDVPGHKKGVGLKELADYVGKRVLEIDVNSMKNLDNLSNPIGVINEAEELMADAYGVDHAFFLINGTTSGVQAMIMSVCGHGDKIILPRNVHKSAINGVILSGATPVYLTPEINWELGISTGVSKEEVKNTIKEHPDAKAIFLINPTYYGTTSNIKGIIDLAHRHGMAVLLDEAHGAHFGFHPELPSSGMNFGGDMAAVSLHKTGGSLTQSSALLLNEGMIDKNTVKIILNMTQSTSASYLLMSSLDIARKNLVLKGEEIFSRILELVRRARVEINKIDGMYAFSKELIGSNGIYDFDETKLSINVSRLGITGFQVYDLLRDDYNIQMELADIHNVLGIISVGDTEEYVDKLIAALKDISQKYSRDKRIEYKDYILERPQILVSPREAFYAKTKTLALKDAEGEISGESIMVYPPGIPIVTPGEIITKEIIDYIEFLKAEEGILTGTADPYVDKIKVLMTVTSNK